MPAPCCIVVLPPRCFNLCALVLARLRRRSGKAWFFSRVLGAKGKEQREAELAGVLRWSGEASDHGGGGLLAA